MLVQSELIGLLNDVFNQQGRLRKAGRQLMYHCPFCPDKNLITQKLEISMDGTHIGNYHCWRCNAKGKSFGSLLRKLNAASHYRARLFKLTGDIRLARNNSFEKNNSFICLPDEFIQLSIPRKTPEYRNALMYLKNRRVLREDILRYNIGYCETGDYAYHIIVPSYDADGHLNFFIGRRYYETDGAINYKKPEVPMNDIVGFESFVNYNEPEITLVEGCFDAIAVRNNVVPLFGKYPSQELRKKIIQHHIKRVNICLDNDAFKDIVNLYDQFKSMGIENIHLIFLKEKDPSLMGFEKIHTLIRESAPYDDNDILKIKVDYF